MKNLLYTLFLICICFIESNGGIENNISFEDAQAQPTDSVWVTIVNAWSWEVTEQEAKLMNDFSLNSGDSVWTEKDGGWDMLYITNTAFDTVVVHEIDPEGDTGYQMLYYTEE